MIDNIYIAICICLAYTFINNFKLNVNKKKQTKILYTHNENIPSSKLKETNENLK